MQLLRTKILGLTLLLGGLALCGTGLWLLLSPAQYQATTTIKAEQDPYDVSTYEISHPGAYYDPYFIQLIFGGVQSELVLSNVVESLNLNVNWGKKHGDGSQLKTIEAIKLLRRQMNLESVRYSELIKISFSSNDPNEAASVANAIAKAYYDYRMERWKQETREGIRVLTDQYQKEEQEIKIRHENLVQLGKQLSLPNPEPPEELLKSNYPSYFQVKHELQNLEEFHKLVAEHITAWKSDLDKFKVSVVLIVDAANPPEFPIGPNRWLGAALLVIGLFPIAGGFLLLKSALRSAWL